jgi:hypothetical protein
VNSTKASRVHVSSLLTSLLYYLSHILLSMAIFLMPENGNFVFSTNPHDMQWGIQDDDVFFN